MTLIPLAEAQGRLLALASPVAIERVPLVDATGRWLAEPLVAARTQPEADLSAMDGYAIGFADLPGPWVQVEEIAAGTVPRIALSRGQCARIFTGAALPQGGDTILIQEEARACEGSVALAGVGPASRGQFVRKAGSDFARGALLAQAGAEVTPATVGLAAMAGVVDFPVRRRVRVAIVSTGDELVPVGKPCRPGTIPSANAPMLAALLGRVSAEVRDIGIVPDRLEAMTAALTEASSADLVVTIGGASVGDHDLVRPALAALGATIDFWRVAMKPGKPLLGGRLGEAVVLGLPGNPASAFVTAILFLLPLVRALGGAAAPLPGIGRARLGDELAPGGPRTEFLRARMEDGAAVPFTDQDSASLATLAAASHLVVRDIDTPAARVGDLVRTITIA